MASGSSVGSGGAAGSSVGWLGGTAVSVGWLMGSLVGWSVGERPLGWAAVGRRLVPAGQRGPRLRNKFVSSVFSSFVLGQIGPIFKIGPISSRGGIVPGNGEEGEGGTAVSHPWVTFCLQLLKVGGSPSPQSPPKGRGSLAPSPFGRGPGRGDGGRRGHDFSPTDPSAAACAGG